MEETLKQILNEMKGLKNGISELKTDVKELKMDVSELKTEVTELKTDVTELKADVTVLKMDVTELKTDVVVLKQGQVQIETKVDTLSSELRSNFKYTNDKLEQHSKIFGGVSGKIKGLKTDSEYLSSKTGKHDTEINNIMNRLRG